MESFILNRLYLGIKENYNIGMRYIRTYKIYLLLFLIGASPAYIFSVLNIVGINQFPETRNDADTTDANISPVLSAAFSQLVPVITITMQSDGSFIKEAGIKYVDIHDTLTVGTSAVVIAHDLFKNKIVV